MRKILGYLLAIVGIVAIAGSFISQVKELIAPALPNIITTTYLLIIGVILVLIGLFLIVRAGKVRQKSMEVPIFHGKNVVGYRRT